MADDRHGFAKAADILDDASLPHSEASASMSRQVSITASPRSRRMMRAAWVRS